MLAACGGSHGGSTLPAVRAAQASPPPRAGAQAAAASGDVVAVNAGGAAAGGFAADEYFKSGSWTYTTSSAVAASTIASPAPQAVYQSEREGPSIAYTIPGLTAGATYSVKLSFAELWWKAAKQRLFNVSINSTTVLTNFDVYATAGGANKAVLETFTATASASGAIAIVLTATTDNAALNAIEIATVSGTPTPTPTATPTPTPTSAPAGGLAIDAGGAAAAGFLADQDYSAGPWTYANSAPINTSAVTNPAPQAVYQTEREGGAFTYTIPGLVAGRAYTVRLDFAELWWTSAGKRVFNVTVNNVAALTNFDTFATAGAANTAIAKSFSTTATSGGTIVIGFKSVTDNAAVNGIEITPAGVAPTPTPTPTGSVAFNDYVTFGYDNQRDVFNPNSTAISDSSVANLHLAWQTALGGGDYNTQTQPILATEIPGHAGVLYVGGGTGNVYAYDALSGAAIWTVPTGQEQYTCENGYVALFGAGGTAAYDPVSQSVYIVGNKNSAPDAVAQNILYRLSGSSGAILGKTNFAPPTAGWSSLDFSHTAVTLGSNGLAYVGTGATCDISSWRGRVAAVNVASMTLANTFFPVWNGTTQPWGGGGVWGWGGVSLDFSGNVLTGVGNSDNGTTAHGAIVAPFAAAPHEYSAFGDGIVQLSSDLTTVRSSHHPIPASSIAGNSVDLDLNGTPVVFQPNGAGCDPLAAIQGKSGSLYIYDTTNVGGGPVAQYQLAPSSYADGFLGSPTYSPVTGLLYAGVPSSNSSLYAPGMIAINPGCGRPSVTWSAAFGPDSYAPGSILSPGAPRSVPAVSAGGVVFIGTICTPSGNSCSATTTAASLRATTSAVRKPLICCAPTGTGGGALWALDASTGAVLNGGNPLIITVGALRVPPTIDGKWIFVLDDDGNMYGLTVDSTVPAIQTKMRQPSSRRRTHWG